MKKILLAILNLLFFVACGKSENKLVIGVSPIPHKEIVELVKDDLKNEGIDLEIVVFNDYVQPNMSLKDKSLDANFFQHIPYMEEFAKNNNFEMVAVGAVHLEPLKLYSKEVDSLYKLKNGSTILIPNDPTNRGRALILLEDAGLIKLKDKTKLDSNIDDILENPKNLVITDLNAEQIPSRIDEVSAVVLNTNYALASNIDSNLTIFIESKDSPYANILTVLAGRENDEKIQKLMKALNSEKVKKYILDNYNGEIIPAF